MLTPTGIVEEPEFYQQAKARGKGRYTALRALAFKSTRIIARCLKAKTHDNEELYPQSLKKRRSPLAKHFQFSIINSQLNKAPRRSQHLSQFQPDRYILHTGGVVRLQTLKSPRRSLNRWIL